ncbi:acyl-CoA synthetase FdrA [Photobacterium sp.]|uniref:acyl-CoA synthetase FdrA n=1 Tax=Photobacterium sp. TaxID=660 RepID=UPI00299F3BFB|nr:acyl-CoA synthetase FdrA [Photobacterium sp.]MDX1301453.1 acyl-CoA synthetase FdrA [Photobacterium sp.]
MINAFIKSSCFQDSVSLMIISKKLSSMDSVNQVSVMMGTPANKDLFQTTGLWHEMFATATPNDICIAVDADTDSQEVLEEVSTNLDAELANIASGSKGKMLPMARSWTRAEKLLPDANLALISVAGEYATATAQQALDRGLNVMMFSDNVSASQERALKEQARDKGLLVMGPDCGTAYLSGIPLAFANRMPKGPIGIVGASGTGIQELCSQIALLGGGVTHALGLGGRDLSEEVGGISAKIALEMLDKDNDTQVIAFVSKPPAPSVRKDIIEKMQTLSKPVVALFLGDKPEAERMGNVHLSYTLDEAAKTANQLADALAFSSQLGGYSFKGQKIRGLYTGGTLAAEAGMLVAEKFGLKVSSTHENGEMLNDQGHLIIDLGDDAYTVGRPHPMIDPSTRTDQIHDLIDQDFGVLLIDVVLGFGGHMDPAGAIADAVKELREKRKTPFAVIATVTGTTEDPQNREEQISTLESAEIKVVDSVSEAVTFSSILTSCDLPQESNEAPHYLLQQPKIINIGLSGFAEDLLTCNATAIHYRWAPVAGGNAHLTELLNKLS